jgi:hypothetical protein
LEDRALSDADCLKSIAAIRALFDEETEMNAPLPLSVERSSDLFGVFFAFGRVGQSLFRRLDGIVTIVFVARENVEVEMKGMLVTRRLIVLTGGDAIALINSLHCQRNFLGNIKNPVAVFDWQRVNAFKMFIRNKDHMPGIFTDKERINEASYKVILIDNIARPHKGVGAFFLLYTNADRTSVILGSVAFDHTAIITQRKRRLWSQKVRSSYLSRSMTEFETDLLRELLEDDGTSSDTIFEQELATQSQRPPAKGPD